QIVDEQALHDQVRHRRVRLRRAEDADRVTRLGLPRRPGLPEKALHRARAHEDDGAEEHDGGHSAAFLHRLVDLAHGAAADEGAEAPRPELSLAVAPRAADAQDTIEILADLLEHRLALRRLAARLEHAVDGAQRALPGLPGQDVGRD